MKAGKKFLLQACGLLLIISGVTMGCGAGSSGSSDGSDGDPTTIAPNLVIDQASYDFGNVTVGKTATLQVMISNTGSADLSVDDLTISDSVNFALTSDTCGTAPYTLAAGADCTVVVTFTPTVTGSYSEVLDISSNDGDFSAGLTAVGTEATALTVNLNQIDPVDCPTIKAYVTVTDQNGFLVEDLAAEDFELTENSGTAANPDSAEVAQTAALSLATALVMDYSASVSDDPALVSAMESGATEFLDQMGESDQAAIIKFASNVEVVQAFTNDTSLLKAAIAEDTDLGGRYTALYDAIYQSIEDAAATTTARKVVIVMTDGVDDGGDGQPGSVETKESLIALAQTKGIPVFTIKAGPNVDEAVLQDIAEQTGGQYYDALSTGRLVTAYIQLSEVLNGQYVLTYETELIGSGSDVAVDVEVPSQPGLVGDISDQLSYARCP
jgi:VWFA-related protein